MPCCPGAPDAACVADNNRQGMDRSLGDLTSKIHPVVDGHRSPVRLTLAPGKAHDDRLCSAVLCACCPKRCCWRIAIMALTGSYLVANSEHGRNFYRNKATFRFASVRFCIARAS